MTQTWDLIGWRERLAGDRRIVAFTEDERDGVLFTVAICSHRWSARSLMRSLQAEGITGAALRTRISVWLGPEPESPTGPGELDLTGLEDVVG